MLVDRLRQVVIDALEELKCRDLACLEVTELTDLFDYMIIVSGTSRRHVKSLAENVIRRCREHRVRPIGVEGEIPGDWILIDLTDLIVHVMLPSAREFYDLERLWSGVGYDAQPGGREHPHA